MVNEELLYKLAKLIVVALVVQVFAIGYAFWTNYQGRVDLVTSQRAGCERAKKDRVADIEVNKEIQGIFQASQANVPAIQSSDRLVALAKIGRINQDLRVRAQVVCSEAFPKASIIP